MAKTTAPYFMIQKRAGRFETSGQPDAKFGHKLHSSGGTVSDGIFAEWHWDGERLVVHNDRYGIYPLFWCEFPAGGVGISSSLVKLIELGAPTELDTEALSVFLRMGIFLAEDTAFTAIRTVPPNTRFEWRNGVLECYGRYPKTLPAWELSRDEAIDQHIELFARAMARRQPTSSRFTVPISGGRDSRHILLELHRQGIRPPVCVSAWDNPPDPNIDPKIGRVLCEHLGYAHTTVSQRLSIVAAEKEKNKATHFGAQRHGWYVALADYLSSDFDCVYDGLAGDVILANSYITPKLHSIFRSGDTSRIAARLLPGGNGDAPLLKGILSKRLQGPMSVAVAKRRLTREIEKHLDTVNPNASFYFWNHTRRMTALAPYGLLDEIPCVYSPFLDHDIFDFMTSLPVHMVMDGTFRDDAIARAYPEVVHISYANHKSAPATNDQHIRLSFLAEASRRFVLHKPWALLDNTGLRVKILVGLLSRGRIHPWIPLSVVYLSQLESLIDRYS